MECTGVIVLATHALRWTGRDDSALCQVALRLIEEAWRAPVRLP